MIQLIRGFKDILPEESVLWQHIENTARALFEDFGFREIRPPVLEKTELFKRSIGEDTDIVEKEMYTFPDRKGDLLTLRPEATASVVRSYIQHKMYAADPIRKMYTIGPMFRRERPQKGRYRQFYQINAEVFGEASPYIDAQLIFMLVSLFEKLAVTDSNVHINSLGCPECRPDFRKALSELLESRKEQLCEDCIRRSERNPLRVLDCKVPSCREAVSDAPSIIDYLCPACAAHFGTVQELLVKQNVRFEVDKRLVRGLDYYTRTTFEIQTGALGAQSAVAGGGRYDGLVEALGGPSQPAIGFAIGLDRLVEIVTLNQESLAKHPMVFIAALGDEGIRNAWLWSNDLCMKGIRTEVDFSGRSLKSLMKRADKVNASYVMIVGESELKEGSVVLRDMKTKEQHAFSMDNLVENLKTFLHQ
ncbi:MAG: histidine--tRNA ligase [Pseudomonadota bacterium]